MKNYILFFILVFLPVTSYSSTKLFKDYKFEDGGYYIIGAFSESDKNSLCDSLGQFYTDSLPILNLFKEEWQFDKPGMQYSCGYHYCLYLCKNKICLKTIRINLNCNEIVSDEGYFYFNTDKLRKFTGKLKKVKSVYESFGSLEEARTKRTQTLNQPKLLFTPEEFWINFEGRFSFTYTYIKGKDGYKTQKSIILNKLSEEIRNKYPDEKFTLFDVGGSKEEMFISVHCNKSLSDKFTIYPRGAWTPFYLHMTSYWIP